MKTWDDWSDSAITSKVCQVCGLDFEVIDGVVLGSIKHGGDNVLSVTGVVDYCNNPADMWPIIVNNKIGLQPDPVKNGNWFAFDNDELIMHENTNQLRAAAIVFLEMNGVRP